jgi:hypothetical protein
MPNIVGIPAGKMIRTSVISDTDDLGLTRLTETYAFATSEFQTFRTRLINFTPYNTVMNCVYPTPSTTYPYVVVETASITEDAGGISRATVQYVGILKSTRASSGDLSWLPPAKQRLQPFNGRVNRVSVIVDFIYYTDVEPREVEVIKAYGVGGILPITINGTSLYRSIGVPFSTEDSNEDKQVREIYYRSDVKLPETARPTYSKEVYIGMACVSHFSERVGLFHKVTNTYQDSGYSISAGSINTYGSYAVISGLLLQ